MYRIATGILLLCLGAPLLQADPSSVHSKNLALQTSRPANVFTDTGTVVFQLPQSADQDYGWRVKDWQGRLVAEGSLERGDATFEVEPLDLGYFEIEIRGETEARWQNPVPFAVVTDPQNRVLRADSPFAIDTAQSWLAQKGSRGNKLDPENPFEVIADLEVLAGVTMIRDRMGWNDRTNPSAGVYDWQPYDAVAQMLAERGIRVVSLYESFKNRPSPAWTDGGILDLGAIYNFSRDTATQFSGRIDDWEFWNEPDLKRDIRVWEFAAAQKAAYLGFKKGNPSANVLNGSISNIHRYAGYLEKLLDNGIGDYFDTYNLHTYLVPQHHYRVMDATYEVLQRHGLEGDNARAIWVTEVGFAYEGDGRIQPLQVEGTNREHDADQALMQAERVVKVEVTLHALGAEKVFFFVLPPFNEAEGRKAWGLLRWDWLVKPGYVSFANLTARLSDTRYVGTFDAGDGVSAYLFEQLGTGANAHLKGTQTLVMWSNVRRAVNLALPAQPGALDLVNLMGKSSELKPRAGSTADSSHYALRLGTSPVYLNGLQGLVPAVPARPSATAKVKEVSAEQWQRLSTVLSAHPGAQFEPLHQLYATLPADGTGTMQVDVYNFSDEPIRGTLRNEGEGYVLEGIDQSVLVPAGEKVRVPVMVRVGQAQLDGVQPVVVRIGADFPGRSVSVVSIPLLRDFKSARVNAAARPLQAAADVDKWVRNSAGTMNLSVGEDGVTDVSVQFPANTDRWVYPYLKVPAGQIEADAIALSFEVKSRAGSNECRGMLVLSDAEEPVGIVHGEQPDTTFDLNDQWQTVTVDFRSNPMFLRPEQIRIMRLGANPKDSEFGFTVRNMQVYYPHDN